MEILLKVIALSVIACVMGLSLKGDRPELSFLIFIAAGVIGFSLILSKVRAVMVSFSEIAVKSGMSGSVYKSLLKMIGIGYLTEIAADTVADFGSQSLSAKIALAGKISVFLLGMPIYQNLLSVVAELL